MSQTNQSRVPAGVTTGGRFTHTERAESEVTLVTGVGTSAPASTTSDQTWTRRRVVLTDEEVAQMSPLSKARLMEQAAERTRGATGH